MLRCTCIAHAWHTRGVSMVHAWHSHGATRRRSSGPTAPQPPITTPLCSLTRHVLLQGAGDGGAAGDRPLPALRVQHGPAQGDQERHAAQGGRRGRRRRPGRWDSAAGSRARARARASASARARAASACAARRARATRRRAHASGGPSVAAHRDRAGGQPGGRCQRGRGGGSEAGGEARGGTGGEAGGGHGRSGGACAQARAARHRRLRHRQRPGRGECLS